MAHPIAFKPAPVDPHLELQRRLNAAPRQHAEALLVAYDVLQAAHDQGLLDAAHGLIAAKDTVFGKLSDYAKLPEGINGIRNLLAGLKILTLIDPEVLDELTKTITVATADHQKETKPPGMFTILKRTLSEDGRRGLSLMTLILTGLGRSLKA